MHFIEKIRAEHPAPFYIYESMTEKSFQNRHLSCMKPFPDFVFSFLSKQIPFCLY